MSSASPDDGGDAPANRVPRGASRLAAALLAAALAAPTAGAELELDGRSPEQNAQVDGIRAALAPLGERGARDGSVLRIDFDALYAPLSAPQRAFLDELRALEPPIPATTAPESVTWVRLEDQRVRTATGEVALPPQLLPEAVARAVEAMNRAMRDEIGREIAVAAGYRSPASQALLFVNLLPVYGHSIRETARHVGLPGRSEHSRPERQGIDFINRDGADLTYSQPRQVAALPEFLWLRANAARFGFALSYPVDTPEHAFSPWHWHWQPAEGGAARRAP